MAAELGVADKTDKDDGDAGGNGPRWNALGAAYDGGADLYIQRILGWADCYALKASGTFG